MKVPIVLIIKVKAARLYDYDTSMYELQIDDEVLGFHIHLQFPDAESKARFLDDAEAIWSHP